MKSWFVEATECLRIKRGVGKGRVKKRGMTSLSEYVKTVLRVQECGQRRK